MHYNPVVIGDCQKISLPWPVGSRKADTRLPLGKTHYQCRVAIGILNTSQLADAEAKTFAH